MATPEKLSIVVPVYNEEESVREIVARVLAVEFPCEREVIAVDDGSTDGSARRLAELQAEHGASLRCFVSRQNVGKGAALRIGFALATGTILAIQDADLEYDPQEFKQLLAPLLAGRADVVYGSRYAGGANQVSLTNRLGNGFLSAVASALYWRWLSDIETCYKMFRRETLDRFSLSSTRFEIEPELTAKFLRAGCRILEVPISYRPRSRQGGKKIRYFRDGWIALGCLLKYRVLRGGAGQWPIGELLALEREPLAARPPGGAGR